MNGYLCATERQRENLREIEKERESAWQSKSSCPYSHDTMGVELCVNKFFVCGAFWPFLLTVFFSFSRRKCLSVVDVVCCCWVLCGRSLICLKFSAVHFGMGKKFCAAGKQHKAFRLVYKD